MYYLTINEQTHGPFDIQLLREMLLRGEIGKDTQLWDGDYWLRLEDALPEFFEDTQVVTVPGIVFKDQKQQQEEPSPETRSSNDDDNGLGRYEYFRLLSLGACVLAAFIVVIFLLIAAGNNLPGIIATVVGMIFGVNILLGVWYLFSFTVERLKDAGYPRLIYAIWLIPISMGLMDLPYGLIYGPLLTLVGFSVIGIGLLAPTKGAAFIPSKLVERIRPALCVFRRNGENNVQHGDKGYEKVDISGKLKKLQSLLDENLISESEFQEKRKSLLDNY